MARPGHFVVWHMTLWSNWMLFKREAELIYCLEINKFCYPRAQMAKNVSVFTPREECCCLVTHSFHAGDGALFCTSFVFREFDSQNG